MLKPPPTLELDQSGFTYSLVFVSGVLDRSLASGSILLAAPPLHKYQEKVGVDVYSSRNTDVYIPAFVKNSTFVATQNAGAAAAYNNSVVF